MLNEKYKPRFDHKPMLMEMSYLDVADYYLSGFSKSFEWEEGEITGNEKWPHTLKYLNDVLKYYRKPLLAVLSPSEVSFQKILDYEKMAPGWKNLPTNILEAIERFTTYLDSHVDLFV